MSRSVPPATVEYPCSDGQPMAESDIHAKCMMYVATALRRHFARRTRGDVYVSTNSFLYYERGNPRAVVAPDVYVVLGAPGHLRDSYLLWNEPKAPDFVLEATSASTRREDVGRKREVYAALGVAEYFLYDPRGEYLTPPLKGYALDGGRYRPLPAMTVLPDRGAAIRSTVLGLELRDRRGEQMLRLRDPATGRDLPTYEELDEATETAQAARRDAEAARDAAEAARQAAEARVAELEARLRDPG
ncbi:MAG: Uma2 family endonuclease [Immundisolibacterales bacterium]|nr:Uma2 family endonuclease [Immundisolibacterales bacterium]